MTKPGPIGKGKLIQLGLQQGATSECRRQKRIEIRPMKADELADRSVQFLRAHPAFPTPRGMFPELFHAPGRQLAVSRKKKFLIRRMRVLKPHKSPFDSIRQTRQGPLQRKRDGT
jgi:hypothetical protein